MAAGNSAQASVWLALEIREKPALWPTCDASYAEFSDYRARTDLDVPNFVCEPTA